MCGLLLCSKLWIIVGLLLVFFFFFLIFFKLHNDAMLNWLHFFNFILDIMGCYVERLAVFILLDTMGCYVEWVAFLFLFLNTMLY